MFLYILGSTLALSIYFVILKPLIPLLRIKWQSGSAMRIRFIPLIGVLGNQIRNLKEPNDYFRRIRDLTKQNPNMKVQGSNFGFTPYLSFYDAASFKQIVTDHDKYDHLQVFTERRLMSKGLLFSTGAKWRHQRSLLSSTFHFDQLKRRVPLVNEIVKQRIAQINLDAPFKALEVSSAITGDVVIQTFFGQQLPNLNGKEPQFEIMDIFATLGLLQRSDYWHLIKRLAVGQRGWDFMLTKGERSLKLRIDKLTEMATTIIDQRTEQVRERVANGQLSQNEDFLDLHVNELLKETPTLNKEEIIQEFITFFFAGTDTTATLIATALYYFGIYPEYQEEIRKEMQDIIGQKTDVEFEDLKKLVKLNAFLLECLRLRTPAVGLVPRIAKEDHYIGNIFVKKGWYIGHLFIAIFSNPNNFENPELFNPKRFLSQDLTAIQYVFAPFSAGGRNCIGQHLAQIEAKVALTHFLRNFNVQAGEVKWTMRMLYGFTPDDAVKLSRR